MSRFRILVIDDAPDIREVLARLLSKRGHEVLTAADGDEGLRLFREKRPPLVIADVVMPGMNGFEVPATIRRENPAVPIVMLSGRTTTREVFYGYSEIPDTYLAKPVSTDRLLASTDYLLSMPTAVGLGILADEDARHAAQLEADGE